MERWANAPRSALKVDCRSQLGKMPPNKSGVKMTAGQRAGILVLRDCMIVL